MDFNVSVKTPGEWTEVYSDSTFTLATWADTGNMKAVQTRFPKPKDRRKKPSGWLYPTRYELYRHVIRDTAGSSITYCPWKRSWPPDGGSAFMEQGTGLITRPAISYLGTLPDLDSNLRDKVILKSLGKLKDTSIDLGVALAEMRETAEYVGKGFSALGRSIEMVMNGNMKGMKKTLAKAYRKATRKAVVKRPFKQRKFQKHRPRTTRKSTTTQKWLEWQYAAKPLMSDIDGAITALKKREELDDWVTTVKAAVRKNNDYVAESHNTDLGLYHSDHEIKSMLGYFIRMDFHPSNTFFSVLSRSGATNPLYALWQKVPFSFVLDWAYDVGGWLEALDATNGWTFFSGSITSRRECREHVRGSKAPLDWVRYKSHDPGPVTRNFSGRSVQLDIVRTPLGGVPFPMPVYKSPVSLGHVANGLSLLTQVILGMSNANRPRRTMPFNGALKTLR